MLNWWPDCCWVHVSELQLNFLKKPSWGRRRANIFLTASFIPRVGTKAGFSQQEHCWGLIFVLCVRGVWVCVWNNRCGAQQPPTSARGFYLCQRSCCSQAAGLLNLPHALSDGASPPARSASLRWHLSAVTLHPVSCTVNSSHPLSRGPDDAHYVFMSRSLLVSTSRLALYSLFVYLLPGYIPLNAPIHEIFAFKKMKNVPSPDGTHITHCLSCQSNKWKPSCVEKWLSWSHSG